MKSASLCSDIEILRPAEGMKSKQGFQFLKF